MLISKGKPQIFPEINGKLETIRYPVYVETKVDGITSWLVIPSIYDPGIDDIEGPYLVNGNGKILHDLPITHEIEMLSSSYRLLGELHYGEGKARDFYKIKGAEEDELNFTVFDVNISLPYHERCKWLIEHVRGTPHVNRVLSVMALNKEQVLKIYNQYVDDMGYEGAVVKSFDSRLIMGPCPWVKLKKKETLDLKVVAISSTQERIEVLHENKRVGVKCLNKHKKDLKIGDIVEIEYQGVLEGGSLRHPVFLRKRDDKCDA